MQIASKQHARMTLFQRQHVVKGAPVPVAQRLLNCPTLEVFSPLWKPVQHVEAPSPEELVLFDAVKDALGTTSPGQLQEMGKQARGIIDEHLLGPGAMLLRGLPISDPETCEAFVQGMGFSPCKYEPYGQGRRKVLSLDAATNVPPGELLDLHNEMCYNPHPNKKIILICLKAAEEGGESLLGDCAAIAAAMPDGVLQRFNDKGGLLYTRTYVSAEAKQHEVTTDGRPAASHYLTWQERTGFSEPEAAAGFFRDLGFHVEWQADDTLVATYRTSPVVPHPITQEPVWFNLSHLAGPGWTEYGDGSPIEQDVVRAVCATRLAATRALMLGPGDVLVMDNFKCAHGRLPYKGTDRSLLAVLTSD